MMVTAPDAARKYPRVEQPKPYVARGAEPGHDGESPVHTDVKDFVYVGGKREPVKGQMNINHDRITWLHEHRELSDRQFEAGRRLERDNEQRLGVPVAASTVLVGCGGSDVQGDRIQGMVDADRRFAKAKKAVGSNWAIIELVVLDHLSIAKASGRLKVNRLRAHGWLDAALNQLADHYRIK